MKIHFLKIIPWFSINIWDRYFFNLLKILFTRCNHRTFPEVICLTFLPGLYVVSLYGPLARDAVAPAKPHGGPGLGQLEVQGAVRRPRLRPGGHIGEGRRPVVQALGPHREGVGDPLLQVLHVQVVLSHPLLHLLREVWNKRVEISCLLY